MPEARPEVRCVALRPLRDDDAAPWAALHGDAATMAHIVAPLDAAAAARTFAAALAGNTRTPPRRRTWAIEADGAFAGVIGLVFDAPGAAELGAILAPAAQGRGIATRALAALVEHAFRASGVHRVHTRHDADHPGAAGLMRTLGFDRIAAEPVAKGWRWQRTAPLSRRRRADSVQAIG